MASELFGNVMSAGRRGYEDIGERMSSLPRKAASRKDKNDFHKVLAKCFSIGAIAPVYPPFWGVDGSQLVNELETNVLKTNMFPQFNRFGLVSELWSLRSSVYYNHEKC